MSLHPLAKYERMVYLDYIQSLLVVHDPKSLPNQKRGRRLGNIDHL